jgi:MSHA biogenesis protein MshJ
MKYLEPVITKFRALNARERLLVLAVLAGLVYLVFEVALFRPQALQARAFRQKIAQQQSELTGLNAALQALSLPNQADPLAGQRAERDELRSTFMQAQAVIANASANVRMGELIRSMVSARPGLTLVSLKTLPVETFFRGTATPAVMPAAGAAPATGATPATTLPTLYKHGIEVTVQGEYLALIPYLQDLERNSSGVFWDNVRLDVVTYPDATLKMTVHTLSARPELPLG